MITIREQDIQFTFDTSVWIIIKQPDTHTDFRAIKDLSNSKTADFLCISSNITLFLEIKDFRNHRIENISRLKNNGEDICTEVGCKVKDTVSGVIGGARNSTNEKQDWTSISHQLINERKPIWVVLWLEEDQKTRQRAKAGASIYTNKLKTKLKWLTGGNHAIVIDSMSNELAPDITATLL